MSIDREQCFFRFLQSGLWGGAADVPVSLSRDDWERLFFMAHSQAVTGLFIDGVAESALRPDEDLWGQWIAHLLFLEQRNTLLAARGHDWTERLGKTGIRARVFKGASVAKGYRHPLHRSFGDIDFVVTEGWGRLSEVLRSMGRAYEYEDEDIAVQDADDILVEFHKRWELVYEPVAAARFRRLCCRCSPAADKALYLVCLLLHLRRHFLSYGIGLKQVCDVAVMLRDPELDPERAGRMLRRLGMSRFSRLLFGFVASFLGGAGRYPLPPVTAGRDFLLLKNVILHDGYRLKAEREQAAQSRTACSRIVRNAMFWVARSLRLFRMMPGEACGFLAYRARRRLLRLLLPHVGER